ncbi:MAG TPA: PEP/pyruvate-binding domain-containing protein, partial [Propionibacteriaceae bacterium]|nr:PEP/pyruvate-binding domain-containing protein [Propionibacteriaceae bacterium]
MLDTRTRPDRQPVIAISTARHDDLDLAGGKGANLGELVAAGFPVPDGFVVSTAAYDSAVEQGGLRSLITERTGDDGAAIRAAFERSTVPDAVAAAITEAYADLGGGPVAVRSSATAEDLAGAAFAGQQDSYLNVIGTAAVVDAVRRCWASLWSDRAIAYRRHQRIDDDPRMAVVVQRMVDAEAAGVMFTANPVTGARDEVVVDAARGLGEAVVSGLVTPEHYRLDSRGRVMEHTLGRTEVVRHTLLPEPALTELATLGRAVAEHFGRPQDIEWAYVGGRIWLVQARPMTALPPPPLKLNRIRRKIGLQLMDYMSVRPYPLDMSGWVRPGIGRMVERMLGEILGLRVSLSDSLPERDGVVERFVPPAPRPTLETPVAVLRLVRRAVRYIPAHWTDDPRFQRFEDGMSELADIDPRGLGWTELMQHCRRTLEIADLVTDLRVDYLPGTAVALARLRAMLTLLGSPVTIGTITAGARTRTGDANRAVQELATRVRADEAVRDAFTRLEPSTLAQRLESDPSFADFREALQAFLSEYGHRETLSPLVITAPTWSDDPVPVLGMVKVMVEEPTPADGPGPAAEAERRLLTHPRLRSPRRRATALRIVDAARQGVAFREDTHFHATKAMPILRRSLLEAGRRLQAAGILSEVEDVFHLNLEELEAVSLPDHLGAADADRLRATAHDRATRRAELAGSPMIAATDLRDPVVDQQALVGGVAASGGRATGPVRVIMEPAQFGAMHGGDVLVCPYTNPAWTPLFSRAAAVVVDSGGVGSHAAIVAREYGIPAVMGTGTGTSVLTDGRLVTVDGDTGLVIAQEP